MPQQKYSYSECYKILMTNSGCSWNELRSNYKKLIQKWHPDRFDSEPEKKAAADEKIKYINIAYNELSTYYRKHGELPVIEKTADIPYKPKETKADTGKSSPHPKDQNKNKNKPGAVTKKKPVILTATLALVLVYGLFEFPEQENIQHKNTREDHSHSITTNHTDTQQAVNKNRVLNNNEKAVNNQQKNNSDTSINAKHKHPIEKRKDEKYFTYGSSIGEVIAIQGPPSKIDNDAWYYGNSIVYFNDGAVVRWEHRPESPLKARLSFPQQPATAKLKK